MDKNEFMRYTEYLEKTLKIDIPTDKEVLAAWYEPFKNTHMIIAKKMAHLYLQKETGNFKLAKLLDYKSAAMEGRTYNDTQINKGCPLCGSTGYVQILKEEPKYKEPVEFCSRCICSVGNSLPKYIRQATREELQGMSRQWNGVFIL